MTNSICKRQSHTYLLTLETYHLTSGISIVVFKFLSCFETGVHFWRQRWPRALARYRSASPDYYPETVPLLHHVISTYPATAFRGPSIPDKCMNIKGKAIPVRARTVPEVPGSWVSQISRQLAHEGCKIGRLTHRPPKTFLVIISISGWVDARAIVRPEGLHQWKSPMTPPNAWMYRSQI